MSNPYLRAFCDTLDDRYSIDSNNMPYSEWISANTKLRGKPFSFKGYEFQRQIVDDMHPNLDVVKCSQVGLTEVQLRKMLGFLVRNQGTTGIFTLPNEKMYKKLSQSRAKPLIDDNKVFNPQTTLAAKPTRSMNLMQFGRSFLHLVNTTEGEATSTPADIIFNDEVDISNQQMLALFNSRLQRSEWKIKQRFSTPTFVGFGVDLSYSASDQREFFCQCSSCNHWQIPLFERKFVHLPGIIEDMEDLSMIDDMMTGKLDLDNAYVVCEKCRSALDLGNPELREWVPRFPERTHARGYRVSPFSIGDISVKYIVEQLLDYKRRDYVRGWHNTVLGLSYTDGSVQLTESDIRANLEGGGIPEVGSDAPVWLGIDVGQTCHIVLGTGSSVDDVKIFEFRSVHVSDIHTTVSDIMKRYNVVGGAVDRHPYTPTAEDISTVSNQKIWPVEYRGPKELNPIKNQEDPPEPIYWQANRTKLLDSVAQRVRNHKLPMAGYGHYESVVIEHLRDMVRDETPEKEATWLKLNGNDHYFHAIGFLLTSMKIHGALAGLNKEDQRHGLGIMAAEQIQATNLLGSAPPMRDNIYTMPTPGRGRKKRIVTRH